MRRENKIPDDEKYGYLRTRFTTLQDNVDIRVVQKNILDAVTSEKKMLVKVTFNDIFKINPDYIYRDGYYLLHDNDKCCENDILCPSLVKGLYDCWQLLKLLMGNEVEITQVDGEENYPYPAMYKHFKGAEYCVYTKAIGEGNIPYFIYTRMNKDEKQIYCRNAFDFIYVGNDIVEREENVTGQRERFKLISTFENIGWTNTNE